ncbi:hypothetical protein FACS1894132_10830 [Clostridia bacterium]|nr:hypothetical protein FACS1894132_10830 [Clostridia bacterium]
MLPSYWTFDRYIRNFDNQILKEIMQNQVLKLAEKDIINTSFVGLDSTPIMANTKLNNPKSFAKNKFQIPRNRCVKIQKKSVKYLIIHEVFPNTFLLIMVDNLANAIILDYFFILAKKEIFNFKIRDIRQNFHILTQILFLEIVK